VQSVATGLSVNVFPLRTPAHVPPTEKEYPGWGVIVKEVVSPTASVNGALGLIDPLGPALGVMVTGSCVKVAMTVQLNVAGLVVNVLPASVPPQVPPTIAE
jgi:hypothetical protein